MDTIDLDPASQSHTGLLIWLAILEAHRIFDKMPPVTGIDLKRNPRLGIT
jgi:hypothetical protein